MNRLERRTDPVTKAETYAYDANGNLTHFTDRKNQLTRYTYDIRNRRTLTTYHDTSTITYSYDQADRLSQLNDSADPADPLLCAYDPLDRLAAEGTNREIIGYGYDPAGRRTSRNLVVGNQVMTYAYDDNDRLTQLTQGTQNVTMGYDDIDRRTSLTLPNGIRIEYAYDNASRVTGLTYKLGTATVGTLTYGYDANGQRTAVGGSLARTNLPDPLSSATYDLANRILIFDGLPAMYDNNGNLTAIDGDTFTWNVRDQLVGIVGAGLSASFGYDGTGRRITKTVNGQSTTFAYDGVNVVEELAGGSVTASLLTGLGIDETFSRTDSSGTRTFLPDALGSTIALTNSAGQTQTEYTYEPFGRTTRTGTASTNSFQFTGRENDGTGLQYNRARYYHPVLQRFISEDPIGFAGGDVNLYGYVGNNPLNLTDPTGKGPLAFIFGFVFFLLGDPGPANTPTGPGDVLEERNGLAGDAINLACIPAPPIGIARSIVGSAAARVIEILRPGGMLIGRVGRSGRSVRILQGGEDEARALFQKLAQGGRVVENPRFSGTLVELPGGGTIGFRPVSKSGPPTIDVRIPGLGIDEIKFLP